MAVDIDTLKSRLSPTSTLTIPAPTFEADYQSWSNYSLTRPLAVIKATSESDVVSAVKFAAENDLRVSVKGGGHSNFNTCDGIILDMSAWGEIEYTDTQTIKVRPGALSGSVIGVAGARGRCVMSGTCNSVGITSLYLGGGYGALLPKLGMGIDSLVSARLVTADGNIITTSADSHADVFHFLAGAGQTLGVVTQLEIKTYPLNQTLSTTDSTVFSATMVFPPSRAEDVVNVVNSKFNENTAVYLLLATPPEGTKPMFIFFVNYFGSDEDARRDLKGIYDLQPVAQTAARVPYVHMNDHHDGFGERGGYKRMFGVGLKRLSVEGVCEMVKAYEEVTAHGDLARSCVLLELLGMDVARRSAVGVFPHRDINFWCIPIPWYAHPESHAIGEKFGQTVRKAVKAGDVNERIVVYSAFRAGGEKPEELWGSKETADKVAEMKKRLDAGGMFLSF